MESLNRGLLHELVQLTPRTQRRNELMERLENAPFDAFDLLAGVSELAEVAGIQAPAGPS